MQNESEAVSGHGDSTTRIAILAPLAARVQDLFGDLELALLRNADPMSILSELKAAWRQFRDAAMGS